MLKLSVLALFTFTASAFANFAELPKTMIGHGEWASPEAKGTWTSVATVEKTDAGMKFHEKVTVKTAGEKDEVMDLNWEFAEKDGGFYDLSMGGRVVGWAHCFKRTCQINSAGTEAGSRWAETVFHSKHGVYRIGTQHTEKQRIAFRGILKAKKD